ncbi:MAG: FAD-binding oxidoreductase [Planctomycetes bacterium]|nr:FAD-binding oxidoreductase [Planctomycetota bacterium]
MPNLDDAQIVIIGGGAVGCGVAYSLAAAGKTDVLLLEREPALAAVTSAEAAGLVGQVRSSVERTRLAMWSVETFSELQQHDEANPAWRQVGSLRLALTDERVDEFNRLAAVAEQSGLEVSFLSNDAAQEKWPLLSFDRVKSVLWCPSDGYLQPTDLAMAYRAFAKARGVRFATGTQVERVVVENGRVVGVETNRGAVACSTVVNAAGAHAYHIAQSVGLRLPIVPVRHEYFITVPADGMTPDLPVVRIPDATLYLRAEVNSLLVGGWEPASLSCDPGDFSPDELAPPIEPDWEVLDGFSRQLAPYFPQVRELGIRSVQKGWPTFTPDGRFIVGPSRQVQGFVMAGGCNAHGVSGSAGIGRHVVESMFDAEPSKYVKSLSPDRFTETDWDWETAERQARTLYESYYHVGH